MFIVFLGDAAFFFTSLWIALVVRHMTIPQSSFYIEHVVHFVVLFFIWVTIYFIAGLYDRELLTIRRSIAETLLVSQVVGTVFAVFIFYVVPWFTLTPKTTLALFLVFFSILVFFWRRFIFYTIRLPLREVILIGDDNEFERMCASENYYGYILKEKVPWREVRKLLTSKPDVLIFINYNNQEFLSNIKTIHDLLFLGFHLFDLREIKERFSGKIDLTEINYEWFVKKVSKPNRTYLFLKRIIDIAAGTVLLFILLLLLPFICIAQYIEEKKIDLFFNHIRVGALRRKFVIHKLRTMSTKDTTTWNTSNHDRITQVGKILRAFRMDELPQGINLIRGDISLVGPRAIFEKEQLDMEYIQPFYHLRLYTKPGITGWAQIKQKHAPSNYSEATERLAYDLYYIQNQSLTFDILIILRTIKTVILKLGVR